MALPCIISIHGNFVHFAPPPISQVSGKLAHCVRSNSASNLPAMLTKWSKMDKIAVNAFIHGGALSDPIELNPKFYPMICSSLG